MCVPSVPRAVGVIPFSSMCLLLQFSHLCGLRLCVRAYLRCTSAPSVACAICSTIDPSSPAGPKVLTVSTYRKYFRTPYRVSTLGPPPCSRDPAIRRLDILFGDGVLAFGCESQHPPSRARDLFVVLSCSVAACVPTHRTQKTVKKWSFLEMLLEMLERGEVWRKWFIICVRINQRHPEPRARRHTHHTVFVVCFIRNL